MRSPLRGSRVGRFPGQHWGWLCDPAAESRVLQGLITGIGFIGGGAILKSKGTIHGTATAASIWNTGLIGMAVAFGRYEVALLMSAINFVTLRYVRRFKFDSDD